MFLAFLVWLVDGVEPLAVSKLKKTVALVDFLCVVAFFASGVFMLRNTGFERTRFYIFKNDAPRD